MSEALTAPRTARSVQERVDPRRSRERMPLVVEVDEADDPMYIGLFACGHCNGHRGRRLERGRVAAAQGVAWDQRQESAAGRSYWSPPERKK